MKVSMDTLGVVTNRIHVTLTKSVEILTNLQTHDKQH